MRTGNCVTAIVEYKGKLQLGEVMPNAIQLMSKAAQDAGLTLNGTVKEMMDLQQKGGLISSKVLPHFAKRMSEAAKANGGLENAMKSNRVAMNQMVTAAQMAADTIFKSGWSEGLTDLFKATGDMLMENETLLLSFGKVAGKVFKGISWVIKTILNPTLSALGSILNSLNEVFGETQTAFALAGVGMMATVKLLTGSFTLLGISVNAALWPIVSTLGLIATGLLLLEELAERVSPTGKKTVLGDMLGFKKAQEESGIVVNPKTGKKINPQWEEMKSFFSLGTYNKTLPDGNKEKKDGFDRWLGDLKGRMHKDFGLFSAPQNQQPVVIQNNNTTIVEVDGETITESVTKTETFHSAVESLQHSNNF
mgnify:CR=1 FL=1